ncbi:uncharacterized protein G2W53_033266 [Senna tora]|uniref:Retrotransposon gag domain-containing protein n=1 Tax=Senna tora TaxID=362788 RepID=A0A834SXX4_9FABA|nr:uncharacterized protein G2W53_033266 [Senna tora]
MPRGKKKKRVVEISPPPVRGRKTRRRAISHSPVRSPISPSSPENTHSEEAEMAEQNNRNVSDYATPKLDGLQHSIRRPSIQANNFEIKPATIQLLQANGQFGGSPIEDPNNHILNFLEICDAFKHNGVSDDAIRLRLFPFSLRDKAKVWLQSLPERSISTWEELAQQFLTKYFPPGKTAKMRNDITSFVLLDNESLYEAWERFKELLRKCPHHGLPKWLQVQTFYNGLSSEIRTSIDAAAGGALMSKPVDAAYTLLETMSSNNHQWHSDRHVHARVAGEQDSDMFASLSSQIAALTKEVKSLADRSIAYPRGVIEDVLVKVDKFIFPADFIVLDYEEDREVPIILGRPFLATSRTIIDVQKGELKMRVQEEEVTYNVFKAMKLPDEPEECFRVNVIESSINSAVREGKRWLQARTKCKELHPPSPQTPVAVFDRRSLPSRATTHFHLANPFTVFLSLFLHFFHNSFSILNQTPPSPTLFSAVHHRLRPPPPRKAITFHRCSSLERRFGQSLGCN